LAASVNDRISRKCILAPKNFLDFFFRPVYIPPTTLGSPRTDIRLGFFEQLIYLAMDSSADTVLTESAGLGSALFRTTFLLFTSLVCIAAFFTTIFLALYYLRNGRPIGAPYVYNPLLSRKAAARDAEAQGDGVRFEDDVYDDEGKRF
jgi:hypothetical protein